MKIHGKEYVEVKDRILMFRKDYPKGVITAEIIEKNEDEVTIKASIFNDAGVLLGTGLANEYKAASMINRTSYVENCETSAIGRALGMMGYGIDGSIASADEVNNAIITQEALKPVGNKEKKFLADICERLKVDKVEILKEAGWKSGMEFTQDIFAKCQIILKDIEDARNE